MWNWLNETPTGRLVFSYLKIFLAVVLGLFLADGADVFSVGLDDLRVWIAAGLAAVIPLLINVLNPADPRYGVVKSEGKDNV